ncbi:MAG TPA: hypothetical protein VFJ90_09290, partial [Candidatus Didemnitutus sp.]|nr:hypothetical protein [Candidatus Didemnitutus sp.]
MKTNPLDPSLAALDACGCCAGLEARTPVAADNRPGLDAIAFRAGTHARFKASLLAALTSTNRPALARLLTREDDDATIALLDGFAAMADVLTFYSERIANESFLRTATERRSVLELARAIGYELRPGVAASTWLAFTVDDAPGTPGYAHVPIGTKVQSIPGPDEKPQIYETVAPLEARVDWNQWRASTEKKRTPLLDDQTIALAGLATGLKEGDGLLIIGEERRIDAGSERWDFRLVRSVKLVPATPATAGYTIVTFDHPLGGRGVGRFPVPPTDTEPIHVFALRQRAAIFGHNAPDWRALSLDVKKAYAAGASDTSPTEWPNFTIFTLSSSGTPLMLAAESEIRDATPEEVRTAANEAGQALVAELRSEAMRSGGAALAGAAGTAAALVELSVKARDDVRKVAQTVADSVIQGNLHVIAQRLQALGASPADEFKATVDEAVQNILNGFDAVRPALGDLLTGLTDAAAGARQIIDKFREQIDTALATVAAPAADQAAVVRAIADEAKRMVGDADIEKLLKKLIQHPGQIGSIKTQIIKAAKDAIDTDQLGTLVPNPASAVTQALSDAKDAVTHADLHIPTGLDPAAIADAIKTKSVDLASQLLQNAAHGAEAVEKVRGMAEHLLRSALTNAQQDMQHAADGIRTAALQAAEAVATDANLLNNLRAQAGSVGDSARQGMRQLLGMGAAEFVARVVGFALTEAAKNPQTADSMARTAIDAADAAAKAVPWAIRGAGAVTAAGLAAGPLVGLGTVAVVLSPLAAAILAPFVAIASGSATALFVGGIETEILPAAITGADTARERITAAVEAARQPTQFSHLLSAKKPASGDTIDLDRVYPEIMKGDWVVIDDSSYEEVFRVESVLEKSRTDFLLTAKTTRLQLKGEWEHLDSSAVRDATVFVGA